MTGSLAALFAPIVNAAKLAAWPVGSIYMLSCDDFHGKPGVLWYFNSSRRSQRSPQQHAAVAGCMPLEARGLSYAARKGAAV